MVEFGSDFERQQSGQRKASVRGLKLGAVYFPRSPLLDEYIFHTPLHFHFCDNRIDNARALKLTDLILSRPTI
jgi:hypothetical protein